MADWNAVVQYTLVGITAVVAFGVPLKITLPLARRARGTPTAMYLRWLAVGSAMFFAGVTALYVYMWWITGGGDSLKRLKERIGSTVRRIGARLMVKPAAG